MVLIIQTVSAQSWFKSNCPRSQKQAELWYFGDKAGIDFRSGSPVVMTDENVMTAFKASSVICDSLGNFLFFTDGRKVWDRTFTLMPNATGLAGDLGSTQPCIIVPWPGDSSMYYIFTTDILKFTDSVNYTTKGLCRTNIDMRQRNGLGDATSSVLNVPVLSPVTQKLTAVRHSNGIDFWLIAHEWDSDRFYAWQITSGGLSSPVISAVGRRHGGNSSKANNAVGYMKASPDGKKLALAITQDKVIEVFDFNNSTGVISSPRSYITIKPGVNPYGVEFSPNGRYLYATLFETGGVTQPSVPSFILQFDLRAGALTPVIIDSVAGVRMAAMQLSTDGKIYVSRTNNLISKRDSLGVIYNPNRPGVACNFNLLSGVPGSMFPLAGRYSIYSLPNVVQSFVHVPVFSWDSVCEGDITRFSITNPANTDSVRWTFGDGNSSGIASPVHAFASPGVYQVGLTQYFNGTAFTDTIAVTNYANPVISLTDTVLLYSGSSINLHAGGGFVEYLWTTGSVDSILTVSAEGSYGVRVKDIHCCTSDDTTYVKVFGYYIPNAFTPNGDGLNDVFRVTGLYRNISFSMVIYNRWGELVFKSDDIDKGWDGICGGQYCPADSYVWIINIGFLGQDIVTQGDVVFKGTVTIVR